MDKISVRNAVARLVAQRGAIIKRYPFFGRLLMRLPLGIEECETAYTDMRKIVFDPCFAEALEDRELRFVLMHECLHCALKHCTRGNGKLHGVYNIACDIVVNSIILEAMGLTDIEIAGEKAKHLAPDGKEGKLYSAEDIYKMLIKMGEKEIRKLRSKSGPDSHSQWEKVLADSVIEAMWDGYISEAAKGEWGNIPGGLKRSVTEICRKPKISWRQILHDFVQHNRGDYVFSCPDKRFSDGIIMPSFKEDCDGEKVENIWFAVDTSGSINDRTLSQVMGELKSAIEQIENLSGYLSFFDCRITKPVFFEDVNDLSGIKPVGGGGTSFKVIFDSIEDFFEEPPCAIVVLTDGYADFPDISASKDIPVFWILVDSGRKPPWGECVNIYSEK